MKARRHHNNTAEKRTREDKLYLSTQKIAGKLGIPYDPTMVVRLPNKYFAIRTYSMLCDRTFASKAEARRGEELFLLQKAGEIQSLRYQVKFQLSSEPKITVTIDFDYFDNPIGQKLTKRVLEDVKGVLTRDSRTKYAWLKQSFGLHVNLIKR